MPKLPVTAKRARHRIGTAALLVPTLLAGTVPVATVANAGILEFAQALPRPEPSERAPVTPRLPPPPDRLPRGDPRDLDRGVPAPRSPPEAPRPERKAEPKTPAPGPDGKPVVRGEREPATVEERDRILADLYAHLATAPDAETAKPIAGTIERLWTFSGSDTIELLMGRARKAIDAKNTALAIKLLDAVVELAPDYPEGFNRRAYVHFIDKQYERALGDLRRVIALDPNHFKALEGLSRVMRELDRKPAAHAVLRRLLEVHPFAEGARQTADEIGREVEGQGI
jgi:hypothetical protein